MSESAIKDVDGNVLDRENRIILWDGVEYELSKESCEPNKVNDESWECLSDWWKARGDKEESGVTVSEKELHEVRVTVDLKHECLMISHHTGEGPKRCGEAVLFKLAPVFRAE